MKLTDRDLESAYVARHRRPWRVRALCAKWLATASALMKEGINP